jgi:hypothetical protein
MSNPAFEQYFDKLYEYIYALDKSLDKAKEPSLEPFANLLTTFTQAVKASEKMPNKQNIRYEAAVDFVNQFEKQQAKIKHSNTNDTVKTLKQHVLAFNLLINPNPIHKKTPGFHPSLVADCLKTFLAVSIKPQITIADEKVVLGFNAKTPEEGERLEAFFFSLKCALSIQATFDKELAATLNNGIGRYEITLPSVDFLRLMQYEVPEKDPETIKQDAFWKLACVLKELLNTEETFQLSAKAVVTVLESKQAVIDDLRKTHGSKQADIAALEKKIPNLKDCLKADMYIARFLLNDEEKALLEELEAINLFEKTLKYFKVIADTSYPWLSKEDIEAIFSGGFQKRPLAAQQRDQLRGYLQKLHNNLGSAKKDPNSAMMQYLVAMRWVMVHYTECQDLFIQKDKLALKTDKEFINVQARDYQTRNITSKKMAKLDILSQYLITPVQRPPRYTMLFHELKEALNKALLAGLTLANIQMRDAMSFINNYFLYINKCTNERVKEREEKQKVDSRELSTLENVSSIFKAFSQLLESVVLTENKDEPNPAVVAEDLTKSIMGGLNTFNDMADMNASINPARDEKNRLNQSFLESQFNRSTILPHPSKENALNRSMLPERKAPGPNTLQIDNEEVEKIQTPNEDAYEIFISIMDENKKNEQRQDEKYNDKQPRNKVENLDDEPLILDEITEDESIILDGTINSLSFSSSSSIKSSSVTKPITLPEPTPGFSIYSAELVLNGSPFVARVQMGTWFGGTNSTINISEVVSTLNQQYSENAKYFHSDLQIDEQAASCNHDFFSMSLLEFASDPVYKKKMAYPKKGDIYLCENPESAGPHVFWYLQEKDEHLTNTQIDWIKNKWPKSSNGYSIIVGKCDYASFQEQFKKEVTQQQPKNVEPENAPTVNSTSKSAEYSNNSSLERTPSNTSSGDSSPNNNNSPRINEAKSSEGSVRTSSSIKIESLNLDQRQDQELESKNHQEKINLGSVEESKPTQSDLVDLKLADVSNSGEDSKLILDRNQKRNQNIDKNSAEISDKNSRPDNLNTNPNPTLIQLDKVLVHNSLPEDRVYTFFKMFFNPSLWGVLTLLSTAVDFIMQGFVSGGYTAPALDIVMSIATAVFPFFAGMCLLSLAVLVGRCIWSAMDSAKEAQSLEPGQVVNVPDSGNKKELSSSQKLFYGIGFTLSIGLFIFVLASVLPALMSSSFMGPVIEFVGQFILAGVKGLGLDGLTQALTMDPQLASILAGSLLIAIPFIFTIILFERYVSHTLDNPSNEESQQEVSDGSSWNTPPNVRESSTSDAQKEYLFVFGDVVITDEESKNAQAAPMPPFTFSTGENSKQQTSFCYIQ